MIKKILLICSLLLCSCNYISSDRDLKNGFSLIHNFDGYSIVLNDFVIIIDEIEEVEIVDEIVIGKNANGYFIFYISKSNIRSNEENFNESEKWLEKNPGKSIKYNDFLLKDIQKNLDKRTWLNTLKKYNIKAEPQLKKPSYYM